VADGTDNPVTAPLSIRAYARHRQTSAPSVLRAIRSGRLKNSLVVDEHGKAKIADVALADQEWAANTDLSKAPGYVKDRGGDAAPAPTGARGKARQGSPAIPSALAEASAREKDWRARLAELEYRRKAGELVNAKDIETRIADVFARCRTKLLGLPSKAKAALPHLTHADVRAIDDLVRQALEDLAEPKPAEDRLAG
jgi:hypothetical protein